MRTTKRDLSVIEGLEPRPVFLQFLRFCDLPCKAGQEEPMREKLRAYAKRNDFTYAQDQAGSMAIYVPGRGKGVNAAPVTLQFHMDMILNPEDHDFVRAPMRVIRERKKIAGVGKDVLSTGGTTTLGADNRMGGAIAMGIAVDENIADRPPLVLLATCAEEVGLVGAKQLDPALIRDSCTLINLDHEVSGELVNRCAGQATIAVKIPLERVSPRRDAVPVMLEVKGLPSGHSGMQIHERRGNALKSLVGECLEYMRGRDGFCLELASLSGGVKRNVIPNAASMLIWASGSEASSLVEHFNGVATKERLRDEIDSEIRQENGEPVISAVIMSDSDSSIPGPIEKSVSKSLLQFLMAVPHGVIDWEEGEGTRRPALSNNVAVVTTNDRSLELICMARHVDWEVANHFLSDTLLLALHATELEETLGETTHSSGWIAGDSYPLLEKAKEVFRRITGNDLIVTSVHAGIECGEFAGKISNLQQISIGPTILNAHAVKECVVIETVPVCYQYCCALLRELCAPTPTPVPAGLPPQQ